MSLPPHFPLPLRLMRTAPRKAVLVAPFAFVSPTRGRIDVEVGFDTDYASVPRLFWMLYPPDGSYTEAAVVHDWLYWYQRIGDEPVARAQADRVFLEAMEALDVPWLRRHLLHKSVRAGGWLAWRRNRKAREAEEAAEREPKAPIIRMML